MHHIVIGLFEMSQVNPQGLLMCCLGCGRDTKAKGGYCASCGGSRFGGGRGKGEKSRNWKMLAVDPNDDGDVIDSESDNQYHGSHLE